MTKNKAAWLYLGFITMLGVGLGAVVEGWAGLGTGALVVAGGLLLPLAATPKVVEKGPR